ncbi:Uncharacterised protein [uncultured archaeon]|nr:Uncharacterised protein [uncultured archaeon]
MAANSLLNFTVPIGTTGETTSSQGLLMPKLKYRYRVLFIGFGVSTDTTELTRQVQDFKRPSVKFEEQVIDVYNSKVHYPGKPSWDATNITLRDDMQGSIQTLVGEQMQKQFDFANQVSASSASDVKFTTECDMLDGGNGSVDATILESWTLVGCYVSSADYDQVDYKSSEPVTVKLNIVFDNAIQTSTGIGTTSITRTTGTLAI